MVQVWRGCTAPHRHQNSYGQNSLPGRPGLSLGAAVTHGICHLLSVLSDLLSCTTLSCFLCRFDLGGFHVLRNNQKSFKHCLVDEVVDQTENCTFGQKQNDIKKKKWDSLESTHRLLEDKYRGKFWNCPEQDNVNRSVFSQDEYRERQQSFKQINWCICLKSHLLSSTWCLTCCIDNLTYYAGESHA